MDLKTHKQKLLNKSSEFRKEYYTYDLAFEIGQMIIEARSRLGVTQKQLAEMINTKQSGIARAESGTYLPSLTFLSKMADALKTKLIVRFGFMSSFLSDSQNISAERDFISTSPKNVQPDRDYLTAYSLSSQKGTESQDYYLH